MGRHDKDISWNPEHLKILKKGVSAWNAWRKANPGIRPQLSGAQLNQASLKEVNFSRVNLRLAHLNEANLKHADLSEAELRKIHLRKANLTGVNLTGADLTGADLTDADLTDADLTSAGLQMAYLAEVDLKDVDLRGADLRGAYLVGNNLFRTALTGTRFEAARACDVNFSSETLGSALGLDRILHVAPSSIGLETIETCGLDLPDIFLKGIGFKDWEVLAIKLRDPNLRQDEVIEITYQIADMRTQSPIQTNSVFLSYAREDSAFVDAIGERLDKDRVRYWRDRHDISVGPIEGQIERAINLNGTVLLVLSKNSIHSEWVQFEVRKARKKQSELQKERGKQVHVLCPVALDDSWESCPWPKRLRQDIMEYHVLDCSDWEEESFDAKYEKLRTNLGIYYFDQDRE